MSRSGATFGAAPVFTPENFGAHADGIADDTAAMNNALAAAAQAGGTLELGNKTYLCLGAIAPPRTGPSTAPVQKPVRVTSYGAAGGWNGYWSATPQNGGPVLDLRYDGTDGLHPAKIDTRGAGLLEIDHITVVSGGTDDFPIFQTTNTTAHIHHNAVIGNAAKSGTACLQDGFIFGGTTTVVGDGPQAPFQGYGGSVHDNYFSHIRRGFVGQVYCNQIPVDRNTFSTTCGNSTGGAIEFHGDDASHVQFSTGCSTRGNTIEVTNYKYGVAAYMVANANFGPDGLYDATATHQGGYFIDTTSKYNDVVDGYHVDTYPLVVDPGQTTTVRTAHQSQASFLPQPQRFAGGVPHIILPSAFMLRMEGQGNASTLTAAPGNYPYPEAVISTLTATQVTDAATTTGSAVITSATAAWAPTDVGMPVAGPGIPAGAFILSRQSGTQVTLSANATATAAGVTLTFGRGVLGTVTDQIGFNRRHIATKGAIGAAGPYAPAGTGATCTAAGTDSAFTVTLTTGTGPTAGQVSFTAFQTNWSGTPKVALTPKNAAAASAMASAGIYPTATTGNFFLNCVNALPASTQLIFDVIAIQ